MYQGEIHQIGTPVELRASLGAKRLELRTADLRKAQVNSPGKPGQIRRIIDVQRFGDRLDLLVRDPDKDRKWVAEKLERAGLPAGEIRVDEPTLENTFVAKLRALGHKAGTVEFPARHDHGNLRGQVAIGAKTLVKEFGAFTAVRKSQPPDSERRSIWTSRSEWRGQNHNHQDALRAAGRNPRNDRTGGHRWNLRSEGVRQRNRVHVAKILVV